MQYTVHAGSLQSEYHLIFWLYIVLISSNIRSVNWMVMEDWARRQMSDGRKLRMRIESKGWRDLERRWGGENSPNRWFSICWQLYSWAKMPELVALLKVACMSVCKKNEKEKILIKDINVTLSQTFVSQMMQYGYVEEQQFVIWHIL